MTLIENKPFIQGIFVIEEESRLVHIAIRFIRQALYKMERGIRSRKK
jgi:hypothetical protein